MYYFFFYIFKENNNETFMTKNIVTQENDYMNVPLTLLSGGYDR
jgi:hypothetical protein